ncbi:PREDICTED: lipid transfer-like protein VAS [Ipomoea nil]|uniref:lipid transfer-like protein VAS n=1 Tax=Ipomoea nil TaxID=35883 RepID=UPI00090194E4|nr:PREDICTED: lipid transfer-like protein VAS [Ipomoea nil]
MRMRCFWGVFGVAVIVVCGLAVESEAQNSQKCINKLMPCMQYLNGSRDPPSSCCDPLKDVIKNMPECLCQMVSVRGSNEAQKAGIDINQAQMLPARCGQRVNYIGCVQGSESNAGSRSFQFASVITAASSLIILAEILWASYFAHLWQIIS